MADILISDIDPAVFKKLEERALARGITLEALVAQIMVSEATTIDRHLAELDAIRERQPTQTTDSTQMLRDFRDGVVEKLSEDARAA